MTIASKATASVHRLRERGVIRVAASYLVIAWLLLQIADVTFAPLGVPNWVMVALIVAALCGLPVALALAWFYEVGDGGVQRDVASDGVARPASRGLRRYADIVIIGILLIAVAVLAARQGQAPAQGGTENSTIAVLPFQNLGTSREDEVLALGLAESVLHQLANLGELDVISRTSSFKFRDKAEDSREIGRQLGARYLLEGSVQSQPARLRVTTQLIDTQTGADVWSMRFDRPTGDIFAVQDEIALQVAQALELSVDPAAKERMTGQGTRNVAAYLDFLRGRTLLANARVVDMQQAIEHYEHAIKLDPKFAAAYVGLAEAELYVAEYEVAGNRHERFEAAWLRGQELVTKALELDPDNGDAFLQRAYLTAFRDLATAEKDYRRGLELSPNAAKGYAGLAAVVYETQARRDEALEMLDRARKLDPLEAGYDVTKALFLLMERADLTGAEALLASVVKRNPDYLPALARLAELHILMGQAASSIRYGERALALDPEQEMTRRNLISAYVDLGEMSAAAQLLADSELQSTPRRLKLLMREQDWRRAGETAYESLANDMMLSDIEAAMHIAAIRMYARQTGDFERARNVLEDLSGVRWDPAGYATLPTTGSPLRDAAIGLVDVLFASGQAERGRRLLGTIIGRMQHEIADLGRPAFWYYRWHPAALAMNGDRDAALAMMERSMASGLGPGDWWYYYESEPALEPLRQDARFKAMLRTVRSRVEVQRRELDRMRSEKIVPDRR